MEMKDILQRFEEFKEYLNGIDLESIKQKHTRAELKEFSKQLYNVKVRSLAYEVNQTAEEMKKEEFPQLLGVHRYPIINEMEFLTENQKIELDKFLVMIRKGGYVSGLWKISNKAEVIKKIEQYLIEKGVVEEQFVVNCPNCSGERMSSMMNTEEKAKLEALLSKEPSWERYEELEGLLHYVCNECDTELNLEKIKVQNIKYKTFLKLVMERDTTLDHA